MDENGEMEERTVVIRIAEMGVVRNDERTLHALRTTLGSCVGIILTDPVKDIHGLAHIMLPERLEGDAAVGKYADTAVPALVAEMEKTGSSRKDIEALLVGGASMFHSDEAPGLARIGAKNIEASVRALASLGIRVVFQDTGGTCGRAVVFDGRQRRPEVRTIDGKARP